MNQRWTIFLVLLLLSFSGFSQYIPLIDTTRIWSLWMDGTDDGGPSGGYRIRIGQPVVSGTQTYYRVLQSYNTYPDEWYPINIYMREDTTGKVWLTGAPGTNDYLLYDFKLIPGDSIIGIGLKCDSTDSVFIGGSMRRRLFLSPFTGSPPICGDIWIEGMGSIKDGLLHPGFACLMGARHNAVCIHEHDSLVFQNPLFEDCLPISQNFPTDKWTPTLLTEWYFDYDEANPFSSIPDKGYVHVRAVKDTIITGISCKKLMSTFVNHLGQTVRNVPFYTYVSGRKIFYSMHTNFTVLFDFGANPGESWTIRNPYEIYGLSPGPDSLSVITVDSIDFFGLGIPLLYKRLYTHSNSSWFFKEAVFVRSGGNWFFFPGRWNDWSYPTPGRLRCYEDNLFWGFHYYSPCNGLITGITETVSVSIGIQLINPVEDYFHILFNGYQKHSGMINLFDAQGKLLKAVAYSGETEISIAASNLTSGIYFVRVILEDGTMVCKKAIKY